MCNRHVPHLIAEYEASKRDGDVETEGPSEEETKPASTSTGPERTRPFASIVARLTR
ncbi:hypothetical protein [Haloferax sp. YSSS75]|uniref:hypothetical protein n=1 Tax=Haloferax sp. YSSS75 TaxID=3388564 RepID=UPI00398C8F17